MTDRECCIGFNLVSGIGSARFRALVERFGSPSEAVGRREEEYLSVSGIGGQLARRLAEFPFRDRVDDELELTERAGVRILTLYDGNYPAILKEIFDPPLCLYVRGKLPEFPDQAVAVVGTRRMSNYGERMTKLIASEAACAGFTVVSGLAYGVDTAAHRATVENGGITVAVLAGGLMHVHPADNLPLARDIVASGGALISEFPLDLPPSRTNFPRRNRIVAGLCRAVIVTEAGVDSGALITAKFAIEDNRDVFAVPGHADNPQAAGCHKLIKEGAGLIENFDDVSSALGIGFLPGMAPDKTPLAERASNDPLSDLGEPEHFLFEALGKGDANLEELQQLSNMDTGLLLSALMKLELKLLVERTPELYYHRMR